MKRKSSKYKATDKNEPITFAKRYENDLSVSSKYLKENSEAMIDVIKHYRYAFKKIIFAIPTFDKTETNYSVFQKAIIHNFSESKPVKNDKIQTRK